MVWWSSEIGVMLREKGLVPVGWDWMGCWGCWLARWAKGLVDWRCRPPVGGVPVGIMDCRKGFMLPVGWGCIG